MRVEVMTPMLRLPAELTVMARLMRMTAWMQMLILLHPSWSQGIYGGFQSPSPTPSIVLKFPRDEAKGKL